MTLSFTEEQERLKINAVFVEDICFYAKTLEGDKKDWKARGAAIIDNEVYSDFTIEFTTLKEPVSYAAEEIISLEWDEYDFTF